VTVRKVSLKVTPEASLRVSAARDAKFSPLVKKDPLVFLGNAGEPEILAPPVMPSPTSLFGPRGACLTSRDGALWICDTGHHRLLGWRTRPENDLAPADWIIGQSDFEKEGRNGKSETGATTLNVPTGICTVADGLAVADAWNHRVLLWHKLPTSNNVPADIVLGQNDFESCLANRGEDAPSSTSMHWPYGVYSHEGGLFVADTGNRRMLIWNTIPTENGQKADRVLGQNDFTTRDENAGHDPSNMSMRWPHAITVWKDYLCVSDAGNNRVLLWKDQDTKCGAMATMVLGQADTNTVDYNQSLYWPRQNTLNMPYGMTSHGNWLLVADTANSRLLGWHIDSLTSAGGAASLFGQKDFHEKGDNRWQPPKPDSVCWPYGIQAIDGLLVISDSGNNRVSIWELEP
jgi:hypothetical protein